MKDLDALIFDLDGVLTRTAAVHALAWKRLFDAYLAERGALDGTVYPSFDVLTDYRQHVDGRPREDGVRAFLASRGLRVEEGGPDDGPERETVVGLGRRKDAMFTAHLREAGVEVYEPAVALVRAARAGGLKVAVVSASRNCLPVLEAAGLAGLFDARVDGLDIARLGLPGKPAPDTFLEAARRLGVAPARAAVIEDAIAGIAAGRAGGFGLVVGVDRGGAAEGLRRAGAHVVVTSLAELHVPARRTLRDEGAGQ